MKRIVNVLDKLNAAPLIVSISATAVNDHSVNNPGQVAGFALNAIPDGISGSCAGSLPQVWELRVLKKDAAPFWVRVEATTAQNADGASGW